uniref:Serine/threonine-protein kinase cdk9 n=1 Tax=Solanum tuberosum TaxID=4113 RepID=M1CSV7_SOLTU
MDFRYSRIFSTIRDESDEGTKASDVGVETFTAEEIFHARRRKPNTRLSRGVPKGIKGDLVAAGWPNWLVAAAGNALNGWLPRRADAFEFVDLIGQGAYSNAYKARDTVLNKVVALKKVRLDNLDPENFGLSTFFDPEQSIPLTSNIVTLWYRPPELLLGSNCYGVGVDLWGVGCVLGELFTGKPIMPGKTEVEQLHKVLKLCGSPSDDFWQKPKLPNAKIFKPIEPYRRNLEATFHDVPAAAVRLMDTLISIEAEYRGTAALALKSEFFTTEPFACDASSLPQCPPCREISAQFYAKKTEIMGRRDQQYVRNRIRAIQVDEANAPLERNMDRRRLLPLAKSRNKLDKKNEYVTGGVLKEGTNSSAFFQVSSRKEPIHDDHDSKGKKK